MKEVKITIKGDLLIIDYCSQKVIKSEMKENEESYYGAFCSNYYVTGGWDKIEGLYVDDGEENVVKKKGKYVKTKEYFHELFKKNGDHPLPVEIHYRFYYKQELDYIIELEDDEEFDIKKVQLVKSEYECEHFPYFILCEKILYDGKDVYNDELTEYCPDEKSYNESIIDELYD